MYFVFFEKPLSYGSNELHSNSQSSDNDAALDISMSPLFLRDDVTIKESRPDDQQEQVEQEHQE